MRSYSQLAAARDLLVQPGSMRDARRLRHDPWWWAAVLISLSGFSWFQWVAINNWMVGRWYLADVGNVQYMLLNTLRGKFMYSPMVEGQHYAYHFTPLLTLLAPISLLSAYPVPLVTTYNVALAMCPLPLYLLARQHGVSAPTAAALGLLFLTNHFTGSIQLAYHFESYFVFLFLVMLALFRTPRKKTFWVAALGTLMVKEDAAVWTAAFAVYALWIEWKTPLRARAMRLLVCSVGYGLAAAAVIWVAGRNQEGNALFYVERTGGFAFGPDLLKVLLVLIASVGGLCLFAGRATLLLCLCLPLLLTRFEMTRHLLYYYSYPVLPFLFFAAVIGAARIGRWTGHTIGHPARHYALALAICAVGLVQAFLPTRTDGYRRLPVPVTARHEYRLEVAREVLPRDAPTAIQFGLWGITPSRPQAMRLAPSESRAHAYVFLDLQAPYGMPPQEYLTMIRPYFAEVEEGKRKLLHSRSELYIIGPARAHGTAGPLSDGSEVAPE